MIENHGRRAFIKKSLTLLSGLSLYGCGGGGSGSPSTPSIPPASTTPPPVTLGDDALYSVLADNDAGVVESREAQLTVVEKSITVDSTAITADSTLLTVDST